jgi:hypothetical protein
MAGPAQLLLNVSSLAENFVTTSGSFASAPGMLRVEGNRRDQGSFGLGDRWADTVFQAQNYGTVRRNSTCDRARPTWFASRIGWALAFRGVVGEPLDQPSVCPLGAKPGLAIDPSELGEKGAIRFASTSTFDLPAHDPIVAFAPDRLGAELVCKEATDRVRRIRADAGIEYELHDSCLRGATDNPVRLSKTCAEMTFDLLVAPTALG